MVMNAKYHSSQKTIDLFIVENVFKNINLKKIEIDTLEMKDHHETDIPEMKDHHETDIPEMKENQKCTL